MPITQLGASPAGQITHEQVRLKINEVVDFVNRADLATMGFYDYADNATQTTPISVTAGVKTLIENDGLGAFTNKNYPCVGVADIYDGSSDSFDWSGLALGDIIDIRLDIEVTTTSPNTDIQVYLELGTGAGTYQIPFIFTQVKGTGAKPLNRFNGIYMGDANTLNNGGKFYIEADEDVTVKVNGWYCKVVRRGADNV